MAVKHGATAGGKTTPEYGTWTSMRSRVLNPRHPQYADYGGRGITICPEWDSFVQFLADMGPKPSPEHSLDRIDVNGNYEPGNCRWATHAEQGRNKRSNKLSEAAAAEIRASRETSKELASRYGVDIRTINLVRKGWTWANADTPVIYGRWRDADR